MAGKLLAVRIPESVDARIAALIELVDSDPRFALTGGSGQARVTRLALVYGLERLEAELRNPGLFPVTHGPAAGGTVKAKKR